MKKTIVIVGGHHGKREVMERFFGASSNIAYIGEYATAEIALPEILAMPPDLVLMDIELPGMSGIQCAAEIKKTGNGISLLLFMLHEDSDKILGALRSGASGYVIKSNPSELFLGMICNARESGVAMSNHVNRPMAGLESPCQEFDKLSARELQVLELLAQGFFYREVGAELSIEATTVKSHVESLCRKLNVRRRMEAVLMYKDRSLRVA
jgi:DNA-binding NarL/FixJ family response regulator